MPEAISQRPEASGLPFNLYITTNDAAIHNMIKRFVPPTHIIQEDATLYIWEQLDWMAIYLDYNKLEDTIRLWPDSCYHLLCYGDAFDEAGEMGSYNPFGVTLLRSVQYVNIQTRV